MRSLPSLKQQYQAYLMQRIEDYKDSLTREELMRLGDEAAQDLQGTTSSQLVLTEVLMQETVDQHIIGRLRLPSFRKWRSKILPLREAQRSPTRWGISPHDPVGAVLPRLEPGDRSLIVGAGADRAGYLLAAHDLELQCLLADTAQADRIEGKMASESLSGNFEAFVVMLGAWIPPEVSGPFHLVVIDVATVLALPPERQRGLVLQTQQRTAPEGLHAVVCSDHEVAAESCLHLYPDWRRIPLAAPDGPARTDGPGLRGFLLSPPPIRPTGLTARS
ncbi:MAG: hypothetical protein AB7L66_08670 [Gemmatimonadales bacterium]